MSDTENLADLVITFAAVDAPALASFAQMSAAGEEMTAAVVSAATETTAAMAEISTSVSETAAAITAAMTEAAAPMERLGVESQQTAAEVAEANARMAQVEKEWAAATNQAAAEVVAANEREAASFQALKDKVLADEAAMAKAQKEAAAANAEVGAAMAGTSASMGKMSVAAGTASASYSGFAGKLGMTGKQMTILGAAGLAVAIGTSKMAADFESDTQRLVSSAGEVQSNLKGVRDGILKISSATGYTAEELAQGMYKIESGGQHGAAGLKVLQAAAEGARAENANMEVVADAVTSALTDYHLKADDAATVTSKLVAATASGKMTFEELSRSLASVLPVASANHVSLNDILGDMASMTTHGMTAQRTTQNLADAIRHMAAPTQMQAKEFALLGTNVQEVQNSLGTKGLSGTIMDLQQRIQKSMGPEATSVVLKLGTALKGLDPQVQALGNQLMTGQISMKGYGKAAAELPPILAGQASQFATLAKSTHSIGNQQMSGAQVMQTYSGALRQAMGDATGMNVALMLTGENSGVTAGAIKAVTNASTEAGNHVRGWGEIQKTFNQKMHEAHASFSALAIEVGQVFLPVFSTLLGWLAKGAGFFAAHKAAAIALAVIVGGILTIAFAAAAVAAWSFTAALLANPLTWIVAAIIAAVAILVVLVVVIVKHWKPISHWFAMIWHHIVDAFKVAGHALAAAWNATVDWVKHAAKAVADWFVGIWHHIVNGINAAGNAIAASWQAVVGWVKDAVHKFVQPFIDMWDAVKKLFSMSPEQIGEALGYALGRITRKVGEFGNRVIDGIKSGFHNLVATFVQAGKDIWQGLQAAWNFILSLPEKINKALLAGVHAIEDFGKKAWAAFKEGFHKAVEAAVQFGKDFVTGAKVAWEWVNSLPGRIRDLFVDAKEWLATRGKEILEGFLDSLKDGWNATWAWILDVPNKINHLFASAGQWLLHTGKDLWDGLVNGLKSAWHSVTSAISGFITGLIRGFKKGLGIASPSTVFLSIGKDIFYGLLNGLKAIWNTVNSWFGGIPNRMVAFYRNAGQWLVNAGRAILNGLLNGLKSVWGNVQNFVGGIGNWISNHKGPIEVDRVLLVPHGKAIMQGLHQGLQQQNGVVQAFVESVPGQITAHLAGAADGAHAAGQSYAERLAAGIRASQHLAVKAAQDMAAGVNGAQAGAGAVNVGAATGYAGYGYAGALAAGAGPAGGGDTHVHVNVQGNVWTTRDLVTDVQQELTRIGMRNTTNGTQYVGFNQGGNRAFLGR